MYIPIALALTKAEFLLVTLGQDPAASKYAQQTITVSLPGTFFRILFDL